MKPWIIALCVYQLGLVGGVWWMTASRAQHRMQPPAPALVAARPLLANHLLRPGDVRLKDDVLGQFDGRYVAVAEGLAKGVPVKLEQTTFFATLPPETGDFLLAVRLGSADPARPIDAESIVNLCRGGIKLLSARVVALQCGQSDICRAVIHLPPDHAAKIADAMAKNEEIVTCW